MTVILVTVRSMIVRLGVLMIVRLLERLLLVGSGSWNHRVISEKVRVLLVSVSDILFYLMTSY